MSLRHQIRRWPTFSHVAISWDHRQDLPLTLGVERAARLVGIGRSSMYTAVKRGDFETIQLNGRTAVLTLPLLRRMGLEVTVIERVSSDA